MEAIKGVARRLSQRTKESLTSTDSTSDERLEQVIKQIRVFEGIGSKIGDKVLRVYRLYEDIGVAIKEVGEDFKPGAPPGSAMLQLADEVIAAGNELSAKARELQAVNKTNGFDLVKDFLRDAHKIKDVEDDRRKKQLEFDFFRHKVADLKRNHQKDPTRIPRNEGILENWRKELWAATERSKAVVSESYADGTKSLDQSLVTLCQTLAAMSSYCQGLSQTHFANAQIPLYPSTAVLPPTELPPSPFAPQAQGSAIPGYGQLPGQMNFGYTPSANDPSQPNFAYGGYGSPNPYAPPLQQQQQQQPSLQPPVQRQSPPEQQRWMANPAQPMPTLQGGSWAPAPSQSQASDSSWASSQRPQQQQQQQPVPPQREPIPPPSATLQPQPQQQAYSTSQWGSTSWAPPQPSSSKGWEPAPLPAAGSTTPPTSQVASNRQASSAQQPANPLFQTQSSSNPYLPPPRWPS